MKVLYFAWLRERLNRSEEEVSPPADVVTSADLLAWLAARDETFAYAMAGKPNIFKVSLDARIRPLDTPIAGASVIAILPPMTGG
jgi:molybdopterin synthase sulfur carrier subunit